MLEVADVRKEFAAVRAVDGVSFSVNAGEVFALLGPNGAGKTTLLRMLLGLIHPDSGRIAYEGERRTLPAADVGYLPEDRGLYPDVPLHRTLVYFGRLRGMTRQAASAAADAWLERMGLGARSREQLKALSKGNQQKVQFISAILHAPRFVVLDEPFSGLDPLNQDLFLDLIAELRAAGTTVLLSAHQMQLVERIADHVMVVNRGRTVLAGTLPELRRRWVTGQRLVLRLSAPPTPQALAAFNGMATSLPDDPLQLELHVPERTPLAPLLATAGAHLEVREIHTQPLTLHDMYVRSVTEVVV